MSEIDGLIPGAIAMLDVLGTKGIWQRESVNAIINRWENIVSDFRQIETAIQNHETPIQTHLQFFSDTVIITYEGEDPTELLSYMSLHLTYPFCHALLQRVFFRGVISVGGFRRTENMIIGPAIDEAAERYEKDNWMGITLAPSARIIIDQNVRRTGSSGWYEKFVVNSKNGMNNTWVLNWPSQLRGVMSFVPDDREPRIAFEHALSDPPDDPRVREKHATTRSFFTDMIGRRGETGLIRPL